MTLRSQRLSTVAAAVAAALALWALAAYVLGLEIRTPAMGEQAAAPLTASQVALASAVASLAGWVLLGLLERFSRHARRVWTGVALVFLVVSLGGPLTGEGIAAADRVVLAALHVVVAAVLVPGLRRSHAPTGRAAAPAGARRESGKVAA